MTKWHSLLLGISVLAILPLAGLANGRVTVEAESAETIEAPVVVVREAAVPEGSKYVPGAANAAYLEIPQGKGNPPDNPHGLAVLTVNVPSDGDYTLWCRVWWEDECSNSFSVKINESAPFLFGENATYKTWHWMRYPVARTAKPITLKAGTNTLTVLNREDGVRLDQVILSADRRFVPVDQEPVGVKTK
jgi:hypothetical protein